MSAGLIGLTGVEREPEEPDAERLRLITGHSKVECRLHPVGGDLGGLAGGIYTRSGALAECLLEMVAGLTPSA